MKQASPQYNLAVTKPDISREWDYDRNEDLKPEQFTHGSDKKVWWKCAKGHEWQTLIRSRTEGNSGCPACYGRVATTEINLALLNPEMAKEWHPDRNGALKPENFKPKSGRRVWWKCSKGHEWQATILNRANSDGQCPYCSRKIASLQYNLVTEYPEVAKEWNYSLNNSAPETLLPGAEKKVWWKCSKGHEWQAKIYSRCKDARSCPGCSGHRATNERNLAKDLDLIREWHYVRNGDLKPETLMPYSGRKVWWQCGRGHEWQARVCSRNVGRGCPFCAKGGFKLNKPGYFYLQEIKIEGYTVLKFGITNRSPALRMAQQRSNSKAEHRFILDPIYFENGYEAARLEKAIKETFQTSLAPFALKFDGYTETLPMNMLEEVLGFMLMMTQA